MALPNPAEVFKKPTLKGANYIAKIVDVMDPKKQQRVKIRIAQLHRNVPDAMLPWSRPASSNGGANAGSGVGSVRVPPKGATVYANMEDNDPHSSITYGGSPTVDNVHKDNELLLEDYPHTFGEIDHAGNKTATNTQKNTKTFVHKSGTTIHISADGSVNIGSAKDVNVSCTSLNVSSASNMKIHASGVLSLKGSQILLNGSDSRVNPTPVVGRNRPEISDPSGKIDY